ncbi:MAG TPA: Os1348 family NHLP clan protein [Candidatus Methylomirabilis sp.]|nr:Os1348 family NHLP clan protein [Candidatus Methylomirabilis sp.]
MSQQAVEQTLGRLLTDEEFCRRFFEDPGPTSVLSGLKLSPEELEALRRLPRADLVMLSRRLDDRICRLCPGEDSDPEDHGKP